MASNTESRPACGCRILVRQDNPPTGIPYPEIEHDPSHDPANVARLVEAAQDQFRDNPKRQDYVPPKERERRLRAALEAFNGK